MSEESVESVIAGTDQLGLGLGDNMVAPSPKTVMSIAGSMSKEAPPSSVDSPKPEPVDAAVSSDTVTDKPKPVKTGEVESLRQDLKSAIDAMERKTAALESQITEASASREKFEELTDRYQEAERLAYLKEVLQASPNIKDKHILMLAPRVDPTTAEGRAKLDEFRTNNVNYFAAVGVSQAAQTQKFMEDAEVATKGNKLFGKEYAVRVLKTNLGE